MRRALAFFGLLNFVTNTNAFSGFNETSDVAKAAKETQVGQLSFFQLDDPSLAQIKEEITNLDLNTITPIEALMKLNEIRKIVMGK